jgi:hypothetical protein
VMTRAARLSVVGYLLAAALFVAGYAILPTRVTFGAGSLRCGTSLHPDVDSEIADVCPAIGRERLEDTVIATAIFALVPAALTPFHRQIEERPALRSTVTVVVVTFWLLGGALTLYALTGAYSARATS